MLGNALLYHITHIDNVESIIKQRQLLSHAYIRRNNIYYKDIANHDIQSRRNHTRILVGNGGYLHDYVPFYFAPRSPMLYALKMKPIQQDDIVYFMTSTQSVRKQSLAFVFTDAHAIRRLTNFYTNLGNLREVDWDVMRSKVWKDTNDDPNRKARRQAEFLVHNAVPLSACLGFAVYSYQTKERIEKLLKSNNVNLKVAIRRHFYY